MAVDVVTEGIAPELGADVPVALAGLVESRVDRSVSVLLSGAGLRARGLASNDAEAVALAASLRTALMTPVTAAELPVVRHKLAMLARRPLADAALQDASACEADVLAPPRMHGGSGAGEVDGPSLETVEAWRRGAMGLGRVSMATVGGRVSATRSRARSRRGRRGPRERRSAETAAGARQRPRGTRGSTTRLATFRPGARG